MSSYSQFVEDYYLNMTLHTEMELPADRQSVLHFFERLGKRYPSMKNFFNREKTEFVLEEEKDSGAYNWASVEPKRINSGSVNPSSVAEAMEQHAFIVQEIPHALSVSHLDCESLSIMYGFDFSYRGNHNQLLAEVLGIVPVFEQMGQFPGAQIASYEPAIQFSLDGDCRTHCRLTFEPRTSVSSLRSGEFQEEQLSVYFTVRRFGSLSQESDFSTTLQHLDQVSRSFVDDYLVDHVLAPLHHAIVIK